LRGTGGQWALPRGFDTVCRRSCRAEVQAGGERWEVRTAFDHGSGRRFAPPAGAGVLAPHSRLWRAQQRPGHRWRPQVAPPTGGRAGVLFRRSSARASIPASAPATSGRKHRQPSGHLRDGAADLLARLNRHGARHRITLRPTATPPGCGWPAERDALAAARRDIPAANVAYHVSGPRVGGPALLEGHTFTITAISPTAISA
jgi:hypothetical protein